MCTQNDAEATSKKAVDPDAEATSKKAVDPDAEAEARKLDMVACATYIL